jgi:hypothetical protein
MRILLDPDPPTTPTGSQTPTDWTAGFPDDLKQTVAAKGWKSPADPVQSYMHASKLIGNNIEPPKPDWDDKKLGEFYSKIGRPETPDKYELPDEAFKAAGIKTDDGRMKAAREAFHKIGFTSKQAKDLWNWYTTSEVEALKSIESQHNSEKEAGELRLRNEWGGKYEDNVKLAQAGLNRIGKTPEEQREFQQLVTNSALGNNPTFIKLLHSIGTRTGEDSAQPDGSAPSGGTLNAGTAIAEINKLQSNTEFWAALNNRDNPGHTGAVERYNELFKIAYGTQPVSPQ